MTRQEIITTPEYWIAKAQMDLYNCAEDFMQTHGFNRALLAKHLGVSKGYVSQLLNGDFDHKLSKFVELAIAFGVIPQIEFRPIEDVLNEDRHMFSRPKWSPVNYDVVQDIKTEYFDCSKMFEPFPTEFDLNPKAA